MKYLFRESRARERNFRETISRAAFVFSRFDHNMHGGLLELIRCAYGRAGLHRSHRSDRGAEALIDL